MVIQLAYEGKTTREIAKQGHISLADIGKTLRKATGDVESIKDNNKKKKKQKSPYVQAFQMFRDKKYT